MQNRIAVRLILVVCSFIIFTSGVRAQSQQEYADLRQQINAKFESIGQTWQASFNARVQAISSLLQDTNYSNFLTEVPQANQDEEFAKIFSADLNQYSFNKETWKLANEFEQKNYSETCSGVITECIRQLRSDLAQAEKYAQQSELLEPLIDNYIRISLLLDERLRLKPEIVKSAAWQDRIKSFNELKAPTNNEEVKSIKSQAYQIIEDIERVINLGSFLAAQNQNLNLQERLNRTVSLIQQTPSGYSEYYSPNEIVLITQADQAMANVLTEVLALGPDINTSVFLTIEEYLTKFDTLSGSQKVKAALRYIPVERWKEVENSFDEFDLYLGGPQKRMAKLAYLTAQARNQISDYMAYKKLWPDSEHAADVERVLTQSPEQVKQYLKQQQQLAEEARRQEQLDEERLRYVLDRVYYCVAGDMAEETFYTSSQPAYNPYTSDVEALERFTTEEMCDEAIEKCEEEFGECYVAERGAKLKSRVGNEVDFDETNLWKNHEQQQERAARQRVVNDEDSARYTCIASSRSVSISSTAPWSTGAACEKAMNTCRGMSKWGEACQVVRSWQSRR